MTKKELQEQINELQRKLDGMGDDEFKYHLTLTTKRTFNKSYISENNKDDLFSIIPILANHKDQPHGLGVYRSKEYAEMARACLIRLLYLLKQHEDTYNLKTDCRRDLIFTVSSNLGNALIKEMDG